MMSTSSFNREHSCCTSTDGRNLVAVYLMRFVRALWICILVFCSTLKQASTQVAALFPAASVKNGFVEDKATGLVTPVQGSVSWFVCGTGRVKNVELQECSDNLVLHTPDRSVKITFVWVNERGQLGKFPEPPFVQVTSKGVTEEVPTTTSKFSLRTNLNWAGHPVTFTLKVANLTRVVHVVHDEKPPTMNIQNLIHKIPVSRPVALFFVTFNSKVLPAPPQNVTTEEQLRYPYCSAPVPILRDATVIQDFLEPSAPCHNVMDLSNSSWSFQVSGAKHWKLVQTRQGILIAAQVAPENATNVRIVVPRGSVSDLAGNLNENDESAVALFRPTVGMPSHKRSDRLRKRVFDVHAEALFSEQTAETLGKATVATVVGSFAASTVTSSAAGGTVGGGSSSAAKGGNQVSILAFMQKLFVVGQLAIENFPENFESFTSQFNWAVGDIPTPWEKIKDIQERLKDDEIQISGLGLVEEEEEEEEDGAPSGVSKKVKVLAELSTTDGHKDRYEHLNRVLCWVPLLLLAVLLIHLLLMFVLVLARKAVPAALQFPRLELLLAFWAIPAIAIAASRLYSGNLGDVILATFLIVALPGLFLAWSIYMLHRHFYNLPATERKANMILGDEHLYAKYIMAKSPVPETGSSDDAGNASGDDMQGTTESTSSVNDYSETSKKENAMKRGWDKLASWVLGRKENEGNWVLTRNTDSRFIARFGALFEHHRGPPVLRSKPTYEINPATGKIDRGHIIPLEDDVLFRVPNIRMPWTHWMIFPATVVFRFHLQSLTRVLELTKVILIGCIIAGTNDQNNVAQLIALLVVSLVSIVLVRIAMPYPRRVRMGVCLLGESADIITFSLGIALVIGPSDNDFFRLRIGDGMLAAEGVALLGMFIEKIVVIAKVSKVVRNVVKDRKESKFTNLVVEAMSKDPGRLERKYFDRWMVRVLKRGLLNREVRREELPVGYYLSLQFARAKEHVIGTWKELRTEKPDEDEPVKEIDV